jgi:hypothetical protein
LPIIRRTVPAGAGWAYDIKHDGFCFISRRDGERVRVFSKFWRVNSFNHCRLTGAVGVPSYRGLAIFTHAAAHCGFIFDNSGRVAAVIER